MGFEDIAGEAKKCSDTPFLLADHVEAWSTCSQHGVARPVFDLGRWLTWLILSAAVRGSPVVGRYAPLGSQKFLKPLNTWSIFQVLTLRSRTPKSEHHLYTVVANMALLLHGWVCVFDILLRHVLQHTQVLESRIHHDTCGCPLDS